MIFSNLLSLWNYFEKNLKRKFIVLIFLLLLTSISEVISLGLTIPFIQTITGSVSIPNGDKSFYAKFTFFLADYVEITHSIILFSFIGAVAITGFLRLILLKYSTKLSFLSGASLGISMFNKTLNRPFRFYAETNSSELINAIQNKSTNIIAQIIMPIVQMLNAVVMLMSILAALCFINLKITLVAISIFGIIYLFTAILSKRRLNINSYVMAKSSTKVIQILQEAFGGIRDIFLESSQAYFTSNYKREDRKLREAQSSSTYIAMSPRIYIEALGMIVIALLAFYLSSDIHGNTQIVPLLGVFAIGAQKMLPLLQQIYSSWANIKSGNDSLADVLILLKYEIESKNIGNKLSFKKSIILKNVSFKYQINANDVLCDISLVIEKGEKLGVLGVTGGGKSTFLDVLMGLQIPTKGEISVDGVKVNENNYKEWRANITHVPQFIYLSDGSIEENIAFAIDPLKIDRELVRQSAERACALEFIEQLPERFKTTIGENGVKLSGGQRQRIGIARALYKNPSLLVLDEATSALDEETENQVIEKIKLLSQNITLVMVTHRISTLKDFDRIIKIENGKLVKN
jgi:ATP-binding cassette subfamily B protein